MVEGVGQRLRDPEPRVTQREATESVGMPGQMQLEGLEVHWREGGPNPDTGLPTPPPQFRPGCPLARDASRDPLGWSHEP